MNAWQYVTIFPSSVSTFSLRPYTSLHTMVGLGSLPGVKASPWSFKIFTLQSTKPNAWMSNFRKIALDTYQRVNQAVAEFVLSKCYVVSSC